ncbi:MAG: amidohydrolase [Chloroflexi bacterium]|nr:amidohydrolase [Chloroflexota bacterium]
MMDFVTEAESLFNYTRELRRDFHRHPELGFQEVRTSGIVANELKELGLEVATGIAETGVIAMIEGGKPGPVVLCRFDMDALPITEETGAEYASQNAGVMHACGHDGHTAIGLTVAKLLNGRREELAGSVKLVFQPAEEGLGGAERMVKEGVLDGPRPDYSLSLHLWNEKPYGTIGVTPGPAMAAAESFNITITGKGAHGAAPHQGIDPILAAAQVVTALQSIVSRNVHPLEAAVVSVTAIEGGTAHNVIPPNVKMKGTIRSYLPEVRELVHRRFREVVTGVAASLGCEATAEIFDMTPAVINDAKMAAYVQGIARDLLPQDALDTTYRTMGAEDMAYMMQDIPGCYFFIGSANADRGLDYGHHHPRFDFDERALPKAAALMAAAAADLLK